MRIEVRRGDISAQPDAEAIVNAANTELWMGSGVAGAIRRKGGAAVEQEAVDQGPILLGEAVITTAGDLPNRFVIHAAAMGYRREDEAFPKRPGSQSSADIIRRATINSLRLCDKHTIGSVAFPALATGVAGFPVGECAETMIGAVMAYAREYPESAIETVFFVLFSAADEQVFRDTLERLS